MKLTICLPTYGQPEMMARQVESWRKWPDSVKQQVCVCVVDDCGEPAFACVEDLGLELRIYRVTKDIPWNQPGCCNLVYTKAPTDMVLTMAPDIVMVASQMQALLKTVAVGRGIVYKLGLKHTDGSNDMNFTSPNFHVLHKEDFWQAGGYNEDFSGHKGWSDVCLQEILSKRCKTRKIRITGLFCGAKDYPDAQVVSLDRSVKHNRKIWTDAIAFAKKVGWKRYAEVFKKRGYMRFPWCRIR